MEPIILKVGQFYCKIVIDNSLADGQLAMDYSDTRSNVVTTTFEFPKILAARAEAGRNRLCSHTWEHCPGFLHHRCNIDMFYDIKEKAIALFESQT